jgi:hypothetical protein
VDTMTESSLSTILWRRQDPRGHDAARLQSLGTGWRLDGCAVFADPAGPCLVTYMVDCDAAWRTIAVRVSGWAGAQPIALDLRADVGRRWTMNGRPVPMVDGCEDVDLSFTPATNLLPVRRLRLPEGLAADVRAAWLGFPSLELEAIEQVYAHQGGGQYGYQSDGGNFTATLETRSDGFVTRYGDLWIVEPGA